MRCIFLSELRLFRLNFRIARRLTRLTLQWQHTWTLHPPWLPLHVHSPHYQSVYACDHVLAFPSRYFSRCIIPDKKNRFLSLVTGVIAVSLRIPLPATVIPASYIYRVTLLAALGRGQTAAQSTSGLESEHVHPRSSSPFRRLYLSNKVRFRAILFQHLRSGI